MPAAMQMVAKGSKLIKYLKLIGVIAGVCKKNQEQRDACRLEFVTRHVWVSR